MVAAGVFWLAADGAKADTFTDGNLTIDSPNPLFSVSNAAPGESFSSQMTVQNTGGANRRFQFEVDMKTDPDILAQHLFLKVNDDAGNCLWGCSGNVAVKTLDRKEFIIKNIPGKGTRIFQFVLTFDPNAGNEFQNASMSFDMKLGFRGRRPGGGGGGAAGGGPGAVVGGVGPTGVIGGAIGGIVGGAEAGTVGEQQPGQVQGEETAPGIVEGDQISTCRSWPKWVWVLMLIAYFILFLWRTFSNFSEQIEKRDIRWVWQAVLALAAFLIWYFFDKCREFQWFVIAAIVGGAAIFLLYLYLFRRNIREEHAKVESGSGQDAPIE